MKTLKICFALLFILGLWSCRNDDDGNGFQPTLEVLNLTSPSTSQTLVSVTPTFTWEGYSSSEEVNYEILYGTMPNNLILLNNSWENLDYTFGMDNDISLNTDSTYYWQIRATVNGEVVAESTVQSFTTEAINVVRLTDNADYPARKAAAVASFNNKIWVIGGRDDDNNALTDIWSSTDGASWTLEGNFSFGGIYDHKLLVFDNKLWIFGGVDEAFLISSKIYNSEDGITWQEVTTSEPDGLAPFMQYDDAVMTAYANKVWRFGGYNAEIGDLTDERYVYSSPNGIDWTLETENNGFYSKYSFEVAVVNDILYSLEVTPDESQIEIRETSDGLDWSNVTSIANGSSFQVQGLICVGAKMYLYRFDEDLPVFVESPNGLEWRSATNQRPFINTRDYEFVNLNGTLYAVGGTGLSVNTVYNNDVWQLN